MVDWLILGIYIVGFILMFRNRYLAILNHFEKEYPLVDTTAEDRMLSGVLALWLSIIWPATLAFKLLSTVFTAGLKTDRELERERRKRVDELELKEQELRRKASELGLPWPSNQAG